MSFDRAAIDAAVARHGRVARVVVAAVHGSAPREVGASMLVWAGREGAGQSGTIGGGALEWEATRAARALLAAGGRRAVARLPLGPALGQCCGGAVTLLTEVFEAGRLPGGPVIARPLAPESEGEGAEMPLAVRRLLAQARDRGALPAPGIVAGWMVEPETLPARALWVWGAGHVGRAIVATLAPLPGVAITWVDTAADRFPPAPPPGVLVRVAADPPALLPEAPVTAEHLILTYSHALDLALCHALLGHGFAAAGLIGSASKWARFQSRLAALGHPPARIGRIRCPIGEPAFGKHPQAIAIGVAAAFLAAGRAEAARAEARA